MFKYLKHFGKMLFAKVGQKYCPILNKPQIAKEFENMTKVAKSRQIWSHCIRFKNMIQVYLSPPPTQFGIFLHRNFFELESTLNRFRLKSTKIFSSSGATGMIRGVKLGLIHVNVWSSLTLAISSIKQLDHGALQLKGVTGLPDNFPHSTKSLVISITLNETNRFTKQPIFLLND